MASKEFNTANKGRITVRKKPKVGRPRKDPKERLTYRLQIAFTDDEWTKLSQKAESDCRLPGQIVRLVLKKSGFFDD